MYDIYFFGIKNIQTSNTLIGTHIPVYTFKQSLNHSFKHFFNNCELGKLIYSLICKFYKPLYKNHGSNINFELHT